MSKVNSRKRNLSDTSPGGLGPAPGSSSASQAANWTAPTQEEFLSLRRYKSFLLPPNTSYFVNQFVWLAHEGSQPASWSPSASGKKSRRSSSNSQSTGAADGDEPAEQGDGAEDDRSETDARWNAGLWLGKIVEIRARDTTYVWMKIRWMCRTTRELREQNIRSGLPKGKVGGREIFLLGPEFDALQPVGAVEAHAAVTLFDELNPMQDPLTRRDIFYRAEARTMTPAEAEKLAPKGKPGKTKLGKKSDAGPSGHLFPYISPTCYCGNGYLPISDPPEPMALCANQGCGKWFHLGCLDWRLTHRRTVTDSYREYVRTSGLHYLELLPHHEGGDAANHGHQGVSVSGGGAPASAQPAVKATGAEITTLPSGTNIGPGGNVAEPSPEDDMPPVDAAQLSRLAKLDEDLSQAIRESADSAVTRGDARTGIVGNGRKVIGAREIVALNRQIKEGNGSYLTPVTARIPFVKNHNDGDGNGNGTGDSASAQGKDRPSGEKVKPEEWLETLIERWEKDYGQDEQMPPRAVVWLCPSCRRAM